MDTVRHINGNRVAILYQSSAITAVLAAGRCGHVSTRYAWRMGDQDSYHAGGYTKMRLHDIGMVFKDLSVLS